MLVDSLSANPIFQLVWGRRQAHNPTLAKIMRLTYNRSCSHNRPQTAACNAVYSISRRALLITRLGEQLPRPRQVSMVKNYYFDVFISKVHKLACGRRNHRAQSRTNLISSSIDLECAIVCHIFRSREQTNQNRHQDHELLLKLTRSPTQLVLKQFGHSFPFIW